MKTVLAIAHLTIRSAVRLRVFVSLFALIAAVVIFVPRSLVGDGSAISDVRILLSHTLGLAAIILALATLWAACASVSQEVSGRQIRLVAVKPVSTAQVWLGKWLGIVMLDTVLLGAVALAVWVAVGRTAAAPRWSDEQRQAVEAEVFASRERFRPVTDDIAEEVGRRFAALKKQGRLPVGVPECDFLADLTRAVTASRSTVAAGREQRWRVPLPADVDVKGLSFRYRLVSVIGGGGTVSGTWYVGTREEPRRFAHDVKRAAGVHQRITVPADAVVPGETVVITFANRPRPESMTAILPGDDSLALLAEAGSFGMNYLRAVLVMLSLLVALAALGVTAGTFFSFPVATFAAFSVALMLLMAHVFVAAPKTKHACGNAAHDHHHEVPSLLTRVGEQSLRVVALAAAPVRGTAPLGKLCNGIAVPWVRVGGAWLTFGLLYPLLLCGLGAWCLYRRELAA